MAEYSADLNGHDRIYPRQEIGNRDRICLWAADRYILRKCFRPERICVFNVWICQWMVPYIFL